MFLRTTAINKLMKLTARKRVVQGGTSAGKTFGILPLLIDDASATPWDEISVVSESIPHLRRGAIKDFKKIMQETGRWVEDRWNETHLTYRFGNGSYIEFFSADQEDKTRGPRRRKLYLNEANNIKFETYHQLAIRTSEVIWIDFNPTAEFWAHTEVLTEPDAELLVLTYQDNEALPPSIVSDIEAARDKAYHDPVIGDRPDNIKNSYWANWWKVYGLGQIGSLQGVIFTNWKQVDTIPPGAEIIALGLDFGFTNDPTALVACYRYNGKRYFDEVTYQKRLLNSDIANRIKAGGFAKNETIADSAEPKSIEEIKEYGINIVPTTKGPDSVNYGISLLQEEEFYVTSTSLNMIRELRAYQWQKDKAGKPTNAPIDAFNHCIDAMRYIALKKLKKEGKGKRYRPKHIRKQSRSGV